MDHRLTGSIGEYFNFMRTSLPDLHLEKGGNLTFIALNSRTRQCGEVIVWGSPGSSMGDAHGRFNNNPVTASEGQWEKGDMLELKPNGCKSGR